MDETVYGGVKMRFISRWMLIFGIYLAVNVSPVLSEQGSVFPEDTCAPPCWFGLIPGESTTADAKQVSDMMGSPGFERVRHEGEFDPETGYVINGFYRFVTFARASSYAYVEIQIRGGMIYSITIHPTVTGDFDRTAPREEYITLNQILTNLGEPNFVDGSSPVYWWGDLESFTLIYEETRLRIEVYTPYIPHSGCQIAEMGEDLVIYSMTYYSLEAAESYASFIGSAEPLPVLTANHFNEYDVDPQIWQQALNGELEGECAVIRRLSQHEERPISPIRFEEPAAVSSLFADDSCAPPCWFGLTPGESDTEEVVALTQHSALFYSVRHSQNGGAERYSMGWLFYEREDLVPFGIDIQLHDGKVTEIRGAMNRVVLLREVLEKVGTPDYIIADYDELFGMYLGLSYFSLNIEIHLKATNDCNMLHIGEDFWVTTVIYHPPMSPEEMKALYGSNPVVVSSETWDSWINGEIGGGCYWAWEELPGAVSYFSDEP
jgi:hypothetical protein